MVLNYIMTDEAMNRLAQYGVECKHYELDADGFYHNLDDSQYDKNINTQEKLTRPGKKSSHAGGWRRLFSNSITGWIH